MKKIILFLFAISVSNSKAQEFAITPIDSLFKQDTTWKVAGFFGVNASSTMLSDWQGGGQNNTALNSLFNIQINYKKGKHEWTSRLDAQYGVAKIGAGPGIPFRKNIDQLLALSKYNINAFSKYWFYVAQLDYRTQFAPGYNYSGDSIIGNATSDLNSPGYIQLAIGLDYKPTKYLTVTFAPVAGKITHVNRQYLADEGAYGVEAAVRDTNGTIITPGKRTRYEFGGRMIVRFKKDLNKNVNWDSYLDLFSNYNNNPQNIDVIFNNLLTIKLGKYFTANIISQILYDDDIIVKRDFDQDGNYDHPSDINGPRLQLLSTFAIGFGLKF